MATDWRLRRLPSRRRTDRDASQDRRVDDDDYAYARLARTATGSAGLLQVGNPAPAMAPEFRSAKTLTSDDLMRRFRGLFGKVTADRWFAARSAATARAGLGQQTRRLTVLTQRCPPPTTAPSLARQIPFMLRRLTTKSP